LSKELSKEQSKELSKEQSKAMRKSLSDVGIDDSSINQTLVLSLWWFDVLSVKRLFQMLFDFYFAIYFS
jgi:hypothetical protein